MQISDDFVVCPYNSSHVVAAIRMPYHLMKCRKNYPLIDLVVCPFNAIHEVPKPELKHHMLHCPSRVLLERETVLDSMRGILTDDEPPIKKGYTDLPKYRSHHMNVDDDNWEADNNQKVVMLMSRQQKDLTSSLRQPLGPSMAAVAGSPDIEYPTTRPGSLSSFSSLCVGRGRAAPGLFPDIVTPVNIATSGQLHMIQSSRLISVPSTRPGRPDTK